RKRTLQRRELRPLDEPGLRGAPESLRQAGPRRVATRRRSAVGRRARDHCVVHRNTARHVDAPSAPMTKWLARAALPAALVVVLSAHIRSPDGIFDRNARPAPVRRIAR